MLRDKDTQVITNVICALNEILADEGHMAINTPIIVYLLNRISEFNEWGQCEVLNLLARYTPSGDQEMFDIMVTKRRREKKSEKKKIKSSAILQQVQTNNKKKKGKKKKRKKQKGKKIKEIS